MTDARLPLRPSLPVRHSVMQRNSWGLCAWLLTSIPLFLGCEGLTSGPGESAQALTSSAAAAAPSAASSGCAAGKCGSETPGKQSCGNDSAAGCGLCGDSSPVQDQEGRPFASQGRAGKAFGAPLPEKSEPVAIQTLLAAPTEQAGKTVELTGNVTAMCTHRRGWLRLAASDSRTPAEVRVIARPAFLVPENAVGSRARVVGIWEQNPRGEWVLRATGAEFQ